MMRISRRVERHCKSVFVFSRFIATLGWRAVNCQIIERHIYNIHING